MFRLCFGRQDQLDDQLDDQIRATRFSYETLRIATINFSDQIGVGGWGRVYRGVLPDGTRIAVKKYHQKRTQDFKLINLGKFLPMMLTMSRIRHPNIHQVIGYCIHNDSWLLVSEYVDNGSLHDLLNSQEKRESVFNWPMRAAVCIGIARGLSHLHEDANPRAFHRDIKPANILLDTNFTPKITDFDTVEFFPEAAVATRSDDFNSGSDFFTKVTLVEGTNGYMAPEYLQYGILTQKTDVYSFGVTMLEIISGRMQLFPENTFKYFSEWQYILDWASDLLRDGRVLEIIDPVLSDFPTDVVKHFIEVAYVCVNRESELRPSMHEVMQMLDGGCSSSRIQFLLTHYDVPYSCVRERYVHDAYMSELYAEMMEDVLMRQDDDETFIEQQERGQEHDTSARVNMLIFIRTSTEAKVDTIDEGQCSMLQNGTTNSESGEITADSSTKLEQNKPGIVDHIVERPYRTTVFKKKYDFPEAVYPPFLTSVYRPIRPRPSFGFHRTRSYRCPFP